jgi:transcriptional regulator with XRE-family HTH domain
MAPTLERLHAITSARRLALSGEARAIREAAGLSLREVADVLGVTPSCVLRWETGERVPRGENAEHYAQLLTRLRRQIAARERGRSVEAPA